MMKKYYFADMKTNKGQSFHIGPATYLDTDFHLHIHDFNELVIIIQGEGEHQIEDKIYPIKVGDVYVIKGDTPHGFKNVKDLGLYNIMYLADEIFLQYPDLKILPGFQALFILEPFYRKEHEFLSKLVLTERELNYVLEILAYLLEEEEKKELAYLSQMRSYLSILFVYLARRYKVKRNDLTQQIFNIAESISYIENNYTRDLNIEEIAKKANLSRRHFTRIFKDNYNLSPYEYIIRLRLKHARNLLKNTELTITEIANKSGFNDANYFTRQFKKKTGYTPSEYKRRNNIKM